MLLHGINYTKKNFALIDTNDIEDIIENQSVTDYKKIDDILKNKTPYGEQEDRYQRLSKSLNKALILRNNINKEIE